MQKIVGRAMAGGTAAVMLFCLLLPVSYAQEKTRAALIEAEREKKAQNLTPETVSKTEARLRDFKDSKLLERFSYGIYGFRAAIGGAATGQGFAIGPEWIRRNLIGKRGTFLTNYQITTTGSTRSEARFIFPSPQGEANAVAPVASRATRYYFEIGAERHNYNRIDYYGSGPDSERTGRTNYRYEDISFDALFRARLGRYLYLGPSAGAVKINVGPGKNDDVASTETVYSPEQAPGIDHQTGYLRFGGFAGIDWRDDPVGPRAGGVYAVEYDYYHDNDLKLHSYQSIRAGAVQHIPFYNKRRRFALRADTHLTWVRDGHTMPFYMQPVVGGSEDLRGYRPYRFRGDNSMMFTAEYRWEVFAGMDAAIFGDAGKVFMDKSEFNLKNLESDVGFGLRFNVRNATFIRLDFAFSHEGFQFWFKFNPVFVKKPVGRTAPDYIY